MALSEYASAVGDKIKQEIKNKILSRKVKLVIAAVAAVLLLICSMIGAFGLGSGEGEGMINSSLDYNVKTDSPDSIPVITDIDTLKLAFSGYPTNSKLLAEAQTFLDMQEKYKVNAIFAAAIAIQETTAGTNGTFAIDGHNWFNYVPIAGIDTLDGYLGTQDRWCKWDTDAHGIMGLGYYISQHPSCYFSQGEYTVSAIGSHYCVPSDDWIINVKDFMTQLYKAAGYTNIVVSAGEPGETGTAEVAGITVQTYTSSSGKVYIMYKQAEGPWASKPYAGGTVKKFGCPTAAGATALSGLGFSYTPSDFLNMYDSGVFNVLRSKGVQVDVTSCKGISETDKSRIVGHLQEGNPVVFHVLAGSIFTDSQHWMAILDVNETGDKVYVAAGTSKSPSAWYDINTALNDLADYGLISK